jgi:translation initiation factor IF-3
VCEREREREQKRAKESKRERGVRLIKLFEMEENIRERDQRDRKNTTSPFLCESERERESFRGFSAAAAQREAFEMVLFVWSFLNSTLCLSVLRVNAR